MSNKLTKSYASPIIKTILTEGSHDFKIMNYQDESLLHINNESIVQKFTREDNSPLNVFIKNIRMSTADGKIFFYDENDRGVLSPFNEKSIICAETNNDEIFEISNPSFRRLLRFYPDLMITDDGMMVFSTGQMMAITYDCKNIMIVIPEDIEVTAFVSINERPFGNPILKVAVDGNYEHQYYEIIPEFEELGIPFVKDLRFEEI